MTTWTGRLGGGRGRGPRAVVRAWAEVVLRPHRFFRVAVAPGDQAPGLTFAILVVLVAESTRLALQPAAVPGVAGNRLVSAVLVVAVAVLLVTPLALHLVSAVATLGLAAVADDRAGTSETVQALAYAAAPCVLAGVPVPEIRLAVTAYGTYLLVVGLAEVHDVGWRRAALAAAVPAALVFGYGFRGFGALAALLARWYVI